MEMRTILIQFSKIFFVNNVAKIIYGGLWTAFPASHSLTHSHSQLAALMVRKYIKFIYEIYYAYVCLFIQLSRPLQSIEACIIGAN